MRRSWLRRNRLSPPAHARPEGPCLLHQLLVRRYPPVCCFGPDLEPKAHFFGDAPEQRPWATKREGRPAVFAGALLFEVSNLPLSPSTSSGPRRRTTGSPHLRRLPASKGELKT